MSLPLKRRKHRGQLHYVECEACRPTLLLFHGVGRCWRDWFPLFHHLTQDWRIVALDHRGHGDSWHTPGAYLVADYAADACTIARRTTFPAPIVVFGHSLGAMTALHVAAENPGLVAGAVLEDPPFHTMGRDIAATPYHALFTGMQAVARRGGDLESMTDALAGILLPGPEGVVRLGDTRDRAALRFSAECLREADPEIFSPLIAGEWLDAFDYSALWPRVTCPLLLLQSDPQAGGTLTDADADLAERSSPHIRRVRFEGIGHQIHRTDPARLLAVLSRWAHDFSLLPPPPSTTTPSS